jgi:hypothetical protein
VDQTINDIKENGLDLEETRLLIAHAQEKDMMFNWIFVEAIVDELEQLRKKSGRYQKALFDTYIDGMTLEEILSAADESGKLKETL